MNRRAILLDRDGTLVEPRHFPTRPEELVVSDGVAGPLRRLQDAGFELAVVTNQSGIARGYFSPAELDAMHAHLTGMLAAEGVRLDHYFACPHHPDGVLSEYSRACDCRKPLPGLLHQAAERLDLNLPQSWFVGDILDDIEAGRRAGCRTALVDLGTEQAPVEPLRTPDLVYGETADALRAICALELGDPLAGEAWTPTWVRGEQHPAAVVAPQ